MLDVEGKEKTGCNLSHNMQLEAVSAERDELYDDLVNHQASKRTLAKQLCLEKEKSARLEAELEFYRTQRLRPLSDQDKARSCSNKAHPRGLHWCSGASMAVCSGHG